MCVRQACVGGGGGGGGGEGGWPRPRVCVGGPCSFVDAESLNYRPAGRTGLGPTSSGPGDLAVASAAAVVVLAVVAVVVVVVVPFGPVSVTVVVIVGMFLRGRKWCVAWFVGV